MAPLPQGNALTRSWSSSPTDAWAVGAAGAIVHFDGTAWKGVRSGTIQYLYDVHGTGPRDVWAVGTGGTVLHYTGSLWLTTPTPPGTARLLAVQAFALDDVWAAGDSSVIHWNGTEWSAQRPNTASNGNFNDIWGAGPRDIWMGTNLGALHYDGSTWSALNSSVGCMSMWGRASNDVWSAAYGTLYHYDGATWANVALPYPADIIPFVTGNAAGDLWTTTSSNAVGFASHLFRGGVWQDFPKPYLFSAIWSFSPDDTWGVGGDGLIDRFTAGLWEQPLWDPTQTRDLVSGTAPDDVWAVGSAGAVTHFTAAGAELGSIDGANNRIRAFHATAANDLWAVGVGGAVFHGDGRTWQSVDAGILTNLEAVWASGPNDVWIGGSNGVLLRYDGTGWKRPPSSPVSSSAHVYAIHGWAANDVWVGGYAVLSHFDGTSWRSPNTSVVPSTGTIFNCIGGSGPREVWVCGSSLYRFDETTNALVKKSVPQASNGPWAGITAVRGTSPTDLWMLGSTDDQTIAHWDGTTYTKHEVGTRSRLSTLWVASNGDAWIGGGPRVLRHRAAGP